ncbi:hypothetical protein A0H81_00016, partial [Grifola frondosa]
LPITYLLILTSLHRLALALTLSGLPSWLELRRVFKLQLLSLAQILALSAPGLRLSCKFESLPRSAHLYDLSHRDGVPLRSRILIHCSAAISRSPTVMMVYLMKSQRMSLHIAIFGVITRMRPTVSPSPSMRALDGRL